MADAPPFYSPRVDLPEGLGIGRKLLLHACCAPCSCAVVECLLQNDLRPIVFYSNSNIYSREEYEHRCSELKRFAETEGLQFIADEYNHEAWLSAVRGLECEPERSNRCRVCFEFRLHRAAQYAAEHNCAAIATTLASSRWKDLSQVNAAGRKAVAASDGVCFWAADWRKRGLQQRRGELLRYFEFYNQQYCGCEFSIRGVCP